MNTLVMTWSNETMKSLSNKRYKSSQRHVKHQQRCSNANSVSASRVQQDSSTSWNKEASSALKKELSRGRCLYRDSILFFIKEKSSLKIFFFFLLFALMQKSRQKRSSHFAVLRFIYYLSSVAERDSLPEGPGRRVTNCLV